MKEFTPELQSHVRQYMWQCALHRAIALSASAEPTDVKRGPEAVQALHACVAMAEVRARGIDRSAPLASQSLCEGGDTNQ
jgi:hypothetical protein